MTEVDTTWRPIEQGARPGPDRTTTATTTTVRRALTIVAMIAGALITAATAMIHLHLWMTGYRHIATIGPLFLLQSIAGFGLALLVAVWRRWLVAAAGALFLLSTAAGLVVSTRYGLFGFKDSFGAPFAHLALLLELAGAVVLTVAAVLLHQRGRATARPGDLGR